MRMQTRRRTRMQKRRRCFGSSFASASRATGRRRRATRATPSSASPARCSAATGVPPVQAAERFPQKRSADASEERTLTAPSEPLTPPLPNGRRPSVRDAAFSCWPWSRRRLP
eukprot:scaffold6639_cov63-Phaeocystis_antarctica.AAC.3